MIIMLNDLTMSTVGLTKTRSDSERGSDEESAAVKQQIDQSTL